MPNITSFGVFPAVVSFSTLFYSLVTQVAPPDHPAGTTWVWDDGSGVVLKAAEKAQEEMEQRKAEQKEEVRAVCLFRLSGLMC